MEKYNYTYNLFNNNHHVIATYLLIAINIILYLYLKKGCINYGFSAERLSTGNYLYAITYMFMHGGIIHLIGNMIALFSIGTTLEKNIGWSKLMALYIISGIYGAAISCLLTDTPDRITVGSSGSIFGLLGALLIQTALSKSIYKELETKQITKTIVAVLIAGLFTGRVDNACHIGGLIGGILFYVIFYLCDTIDSRCRYINLQNYFKAKKVNKGRCF